MVQTLEQGICCQRDLWVDYEYLKIEDLKIWKHSIDSDNGNYIKSEYEFSYFDVLSLGWKAVVPQKKVNSI